jgi:hypothetical protein
MSYETLKVNGVASQNNDIELTLSDFIQGDPAEGYIPKKTLQGWEASPAPVDGETELLTASYVVHPTNSLSSTYNFSYSTTYWALNWPRSIVSRYVYGDATYVNVSRPPSYLFPHNPWTCGVTLTAGTYLINAVPSQNGGPVIWSLYHTPTSSLSGTYFGNRVTVKSTDGKRSSALIGLLEITETRNVYIKLVSGSATYADANTFQSTFLNVRKLS